MAEDNIRIYQFNVPGFIPGVPGDWPAGSWATINEDTKEILDWGPKLADPPAVEQPTEPEIPAVQVAG